MSNNMRHFGGKGISLDGDAPILIVSDDDSSGDCGIWLREDKTHGLPTDATGNVYGTFIKYVSSSNVLEVETYYGDITVGANRTTAISIDRDTGQTTLLGNAMPTGLGASGQFLRTDGAGVLMGQNTFLNGKF